MSQCRYATMLPSNCCPSAGTKSTALIVRPLTSVCDEKAWPQVNTCCHLEIHLVSTDLELHAGWDTRPLARGMMSVSALLIIIGHGNQHIANLAQLDLVAMLDAQHLRHHERLSVGHQLVNGDTPVWY